MLCGYGNCGSNEKNGTLRVAGDGEGHCVERDDDFEDDQDDDVPFHAQAPALVEQIEHGFDRSGQQFLFSFEGGASL